MATLWEKPGSGLLANAGQTALVECDQCPCSSSSSSSSGIGTDCCGNQLAQMFVTIASTCAGIPNGTVVEVNFDGYWFGNLGLWSGSTTVAGCGEIEVTVRETSGPPVCNLSLKIVANGVDCYTGEFNPVPCPVVSTAFPTTAATCGCCSGDLTPTLSA